MGQARGVGGPEGVRDPPVGNGALRLKGCWFRDVKEARQTPGLPVVGILSLLGLGLLVLSLFTLQR